MYRHHLKRNNLLREYERRIKELEAVEKLAREFVEFWFHPTGSDDHEADGKVEALRDALPTKREDDNQPEPI